MERFDIIGYWQRTSVQQSCQQAMVQKNGKSAESTPSYVLILQVDGIEIDAQYNIQHDQKRVDKMTVPSYGVV